MVADLVVKTFFLRLLQLSGAACLKAGAAALGGGSRRGWRACQLTLVLAGSHGRVGGVGLVSGVL